MDVDLIGVRTRFRIVLRQGSTIVERLIPRFGLGLGDHLTIPLETIDIYLRIVLLQYADAYILRFDRLGEHVVQSAGTQRISIRSYAHMQQSSLPPPRLQTQGVVAALLQYVRTRPSLGARRSAAFVIRIVGYVSDAVLSEGRLILSQEYASVRSHARTLLSLAVLAALAAGALPPLIIILLLLPLSTLQLGSSASRASAGRIILRSGHVAEEIIFAGTIVRVVETGVHVLAS
mmetsp:Transcript_18828/g.54467  ORF Transcript_18828/g.54467 Transcript_18828/m.54467 type:complete len:233 (+) Transcript_18828:1502-2200(+)